MSHILNDPLCPATRVTGNAQFRKGDTSCLSPLVKGDTSCLSPLVKGDTSHLPPLVKGDTSHLPPLQRGIEGDFIGILK